MKMKTRSLIGGAAIGGLSTLAFAFAPVGSAQAATLVPINTLRNTGVNSSGGLLGDGASDANYTISFNGGPATAPVARTNPLAGAWLGPDSVSQWIGPNTDASFNAAPGTYTYTTKFSLDGFIASTAAISGKWAADNQGVNVFLNGTALNFSTPSPGYATFSTFTIGAGSFQSGENTLAFVIDNLNDAGGANNPVGLRVELAGLAEAEAIPEPSEMLGTLVALGSVVLLKRKLTKKK